MKVWRYVDFKTRISTAARQKSTRFELKANIATELF